MKTNKSFYLFDFLKNFFKLHNIPIMIYLVMNVVFIYIGSLILTQVYLELLSVDVSITSKDFYIITALIISVTYIAAICISLSPIGEWILREREHCVKLEEADISFSERKRISTLFNEVYKTAISTDPAISEKINLFVKKDTELNAFAMGRRTICITTGLLALTDNQIKAVLGHEFGHLSHKDTDLTLVINIANWLTNIIFLGVWGLLYICKLFTKLLQIIFSSFNEGIVDFILLILEVAIEFLAFILIKIFQKAWLFFGNLLLYATRRGAEYKADEFSCELGYYIGLISFFKLLPDSIQGKKSTFKKIISELTAITSTHPVTWKRINNIKNKLSNNMFLLT